MCFVNCQVIKIIFVFSVEVSQSTAFLIAKTYMYTDHVITNDLARILSPVFQLHIPWHLAKLSSIPSACTPMVLLYFLAQMHGQSNYLSIYC